MQIRMTADPIDESNAGYAGLLGRGRVNFGRALSESPGGVEIVSFEFHTPSGSPIIMSGDTLVLSVSVRNILGAAAINLSFIASSNDPILDAIQENAAIARLDSGSQMILPEFRFVVGALQGSKQLLVRLDWTSNVDEHDAREFKANVVEKTGVWEKQSSPTPLTLTTVKAVNADIAWAGGGPWGGRVVIRTVDGGKTWRDVTGNLPSMGIWCMTAIDADRAWIGSTTGLIYATKDGGSFWAQQFYPGMTTRFLDGF
jgi:hypothetical protein